MSPEKVKALIEALTLAVNANTELIVPQGDELFSFKALEDPIEVKQGMIKIGGSVSVWGQKDLGQFANLFIFSDGVTIQMRLESAE